MRVNPFDIKSTDLELDLCIRLWIKIEENFKAKKFKLKRSLPSLDLKQLVFILTYGIEHQLKSNLIRKISILANKILKQETDNIICKLEISILMYKYNFFNIYKTNLSK